MDNLIVDNDELKYRVLDKNGKVLREGVIRSVAERFIENLRESKQEGVRMVPIIETGEQVLFG
jgi:hypothetical protein